MEKQPGEITEFTNSEPEKIDKESIKAEFVTANEKRDYSIYTRAMDAALEAKAASIFPFFNIGEGDVIIDAGSGTGALAELAAREFRVAHVYALDISHELQERANESKALTRLVFGDAADQNFSENSVKLKYFSTSGHEIESFGGPGSMRQALKNTWRELEPGGQVIVRDFAKADPGPPVFMKINSSAGLTELPADVSEAKIDYNLLSPQLILERFQKEFGGGDRFQYELVNIQGVEYVKIDPEWAHEFYLRKDYTGNWRQEIREKYTYWTPAEAQATLTDLGYVNVKVIPDPNEWILANRLRNKIELYRFNDQETLVPLDFPPTHMIVVGEKPKDVPEGKENVLPPVVDYNEALASINIDRERSKVLVGDHEFIVTAAATVVGTKKEIFRLAGDPPRVLKVVRNDTHNDHNVFKSMYQIIARQDILRSENIPHLKILETDPESPPCRYLVQEAASEGSLSGAELIRTGELTENDIEQMAKIVNVFEKGKQWQLDTNPHSWFRVRQEDGSTEMVYVSGKVYLYDENWAFPKVGLLQWVDPEYVARSRNFAAAIPTNQAYCQFKQNWSKAEGISGLWKKYLDIDI